MVSFILVLTSAVTQVRDGAWAGGLATALMMLPTPLFVWLASSLMRNKAVEFITIALVVVALCLPMTVILVARRVYNVNAIVVAWQGRGIQSQTLDRFPCRPVLVGLT